MLEDEAKGAEPSPAASAAGPELVCRPTQPTNNSRRAARFRPRPPRPNPDPEPDPSPDPDPTPEPTPDPDVCVCFPPLPEGDDEDNEEEASFLFFSDLRCCASASVFVRCGPGGV